MIVIDYSSLWLELRHITKFKLLYQITGIEILKILECIEFERTDLFCLVVNITDGFLSKSNLPWWINYGCKHNEG
jgi:hypothetical protein